MDSNHAEIREAFDRVPGCDVVDTHALGNGFPDLVVHWRGRTIEIEVKDGSKPPSGRRLTPDEITYHARAALSGVRIEIVTCVADVARVLGI